MEFRNTNPIAKGKPSHAFSRTDLLMILAVLTFLTVCFRQMLASPRDASYQAHCADNVRRIMLAQQMYASENHDYLPWPNFGSSLTSTGWAYGGQLGKVQSPASGLLWKYLLDEKIYQCPHDFDRTNDFIFGKAASPPSYFAARQYRVSSYVMNAAICGYGNLGFTTFKLSQFRPNAIASCEPDEGAPTLINDGAFSPNEAISQRHQVGANVGRFDGGAEFMTSSHFYLERAKTMPNRVWCNPGTLTGQ